jgi:hypothetical protein
MLYSMVQCVSLVRRVEYEAIHSMRPLWNVQHNYERKVFPSFQSALDARKVSDSKQREQVMADFLVRHANDEPW